MVPTLRTRMQLSTLRVGVLVEAERPGRSIQCQSTIRLSPPSCANGCAEPVWHNPKQQEEKPMWKKPSFTDLRIGFEVTMYFASR